MFKKRTNGGYLFGLNGIHSKENVKYHYSNQRLSNCFRTY